MSRRARATKRIPRADSKYNSRTIGRFINKIMQRGKKVTAEGLVYGAFEIIQEKTKKSPTEVFEQALKKYFRGERDGRTIEILENMQK